MCKSARRLPLTWPERKRKAGFPSKWQRHEHVWQHWDANARCDGVPRVAAWGARAGKNDCLVVGWIFSGRQSQWIIPHGKTQQTASTSGLWIFPSPYFWILAECSQWGASSGRSSSRHQCFHLFFFFLTWTWTLNLSSSDSWMSWAESFPKAAIFTPSSGN